MTTYVAFYLRVSTPGQCNSYGPTVQENKCNEIAQEHGWTSYKTYYNTKSISGDVAVEDRPEFMEMIEDGRNKKFEIVIFSHIDRLGRKSEITDKALDILFDANLKIYIGKWFIENNDLGRLRAKLWGSNAEIDKMVMLWKTEKGMKRAGIERGERQGPVSYGYRRNGKNIEIVENEANVIIRIYEERLKGTRQNKIAEMLNNENIKPPKSEKWSQSSISSLLKTPKREIYQGGLRNNNERGVCWPKILPDHLHVKIEQVEDSE